MQEMYFGAVPLTEEHIDALAENLREGDVVECECQGLTPREALEVGMLADGEAFAVLYQGTPIGAIGWNVDGAVWSLWTPLDRIHSRLILRVTRRWFHKFAEQAEARGVLLCNYVWDRNLAAIGWLRASNAVDFREDLAEHIMDKRLVPFVVRPSMELR
jgi:hypothetical protein